MQQWAIAPSWLTEFYNKNLRIFFDNVTETSGNNFHIIVTYEYLYLFYIYIYIYSQTNTQ